jgi:polysaccharide export outer membrane protein
MPKRLLAVAILFSFAVLGADTPQGFGDRRYHLQANDSLALAYRYSPEYNETLTIQPDGFVSIKLIGDLKLGGLSLDEARTAVLTRLKTRLNDPEITLTLLEFERPAYTVAGQVGTPGRYEIHGRINAIEAIAVAGGFKDSAKHSQVILFRRISPEMAQTHVFDLKKMMDPAHPHIEESVDIQAGDLLIVPKSRISKIADYVHWVSIGSYIPL